MTASELSSLLSEKSSISSRTRSRKRSSNLRGSRRSFSPASGSGSRERPEGPPAGSRGVADATLRGTGTPLEIPRLRWALLKEAVRPVHSIDVGRVPQALRGGHRRRLSRFPSLTTLLGRFRFREAKEPLDGLSRLEKAERWLPFEVGRCFSMPARGRGGSWRRTSASRP